MSLWWRHQPWIRRTWEIHKLLHSSLLIQNTGSADIFYRNTELRLIPSGHIQIYAYLPKYLLPPVLESRKALNRVYHKMEEGILQDMNLHEMVCFFWFLCLQFPRRNDRKLQSGCSCLQFFVYGKFRWSNVLPVSDPSHHAGTGVHMRTACKCFRLLLLHTP